MAAQSLPRILIVGAGLLGASAGLKWRSLGGTAFIRDLSPTAAAIACDLGAGRPWSTQEDDPEIVVVATPPEAVPEAVAAALAEFPEAVVTDVASIKSSVLEAVLQRLAAEGRSSDAQRYVPGHPMAGRERSGPVAARSELFEAMPWIICPAASAGLDLEEAEGSVSRGAVDRVEHLASTLGGLVVRMDARQHDEAVALISHLPQVAASLVASRLTEGEASALALAGNGLKDTTRIAESDPRLWVQILAGNAGPVRRQLERLQADLSSVLSALSEPTAPGAQLALAQVLDGGNAGRSRIPGKHGSAAQHFARVMVLLDDRPGQLGRLFNVLADLGVNVEDVRMEHASGREVGAVELSVLPHLGQRTADELTARGMNAYDIS